LQKFILFERREPAVAPEEPARGLGLDGIRRGGIFFQHGHDGLEALKGESLTTKIKV
jgi:hypothetical protein